MSERKTARSEGETAPIFPPGTEGVIVPDDNREPDDVRTAAIDLNSPLGVVIDQNGTHPDERGDNVEANEAAQELLDESEPVDPNSDYIGDRVTADAINTPASVYLDPALDTVDPPVEEAPPVEPPPEPVPDPPLDSGLLRRVEA